MKLLTASILFLFTTNVIARDIEYMLEVRGMVCAYCAYNVSKQLKSLRGVIPDSVDVQLENGIVTLRSNKTLGENRLSELILAAGFELSSVKKTTLASAARRQDLPGSVVMSVTINKDQLDKGQFDTLLEAVGSIAIEHSAQVLVTAPDHLEAAILKPVLAGRKVVIKVEYVCANRPDNFIQIDLLVD